MKRSISAIALSLAAGAAMADCPSTLADAANGVYVEFSDLLVRYDRRPDGTVEEMEFDTATNSFFRYLSHHGIFILQSWEMIGTLLQTDTHEVITYDVPLPPQITANMTFAAQSLVRYGTDAPFNEPLQITVGAQEMQTIGACTMATLPVRMQTGPAGDVYISNFTYFPALGFGIFVGGGPIGGTQDVFRPIYIGTEPRSAAEAVPAPARPAK